MAICSRCGKKIGLVTALVHDEKKLCLTCIVADERAERELKQKPQQKSQHKPQSVSIGKLEALRDSGAIPEPAQSQLMDFNQQEQERLKKEAQALAIREKALHEKEQELEKLSLKLKTQSKSEESGSDSQFENKMQASQPLTKKEKAQRKKANNTALQDLKELSLAAEATKRALEANNSGWNGSFSQPKFNPQPVFNDLTPITRSNLNYTPPPPPPPEKQGFSTGKAVVGATLFGPMGLIFGLHGADKPKPYLPEPKLSPKADAWVTVIGLIAGLIWGFVNEPIITSVLLFIVIAVIVIALIFTK